MVHVAGDSGFIAWANGVDASLAAEEAARIAADALKAPLAAPALTGAATLNGVALETTAGAAAKVAAQAATDSGTYVSMVVPVAGETNAATVTRLNAALAAASAFGVRKTVRLVGDFTINAPLIIPSRTTLLATDATVTLAAGSNCNMVNNQSVTPVTTATDGAMTSGSAVLTSAALAAVAVVGQTVTVAGATTSGYLLVANVTAVGGGTVTLSKAAGTTVSAAAVTLYNRDTDIAVVGGKWDRGANGGVGTANHSLRFRHVDRLTVSDLYVLETGGKYFINPGDCTQVTVRNILSEVSSSPLQFNGPIDKFVVDNITGTSGDDFVAFTPQDYSTYNDTLGDITNGVVSNLLGASTSATMFKILGGKDCVSSGIRAYNIKGSGSNFGVWIGDDNSGGAGLVGGLVDDIQLERVAVTVPNNSRMFYINGTNMGRMRIAGAYFKNASSTTDVLAVTGSAVIASLVVEDVTVADHGAGMHVITIGTSTVTELIVDRVRLKSTTGSGSLVCVTGTVTDLTLRGLSGRPGSVSGYALALLGASGNVTRATLSDCHLIGMGGMVQASTAGATLTNIEASNVTTSGCAWLMDVNITTEVHLSNVTHKSATSGIANIRASAVVTLNGAGNALNGGFTIAAGGKVAVRAFDTPPTTNAGGVPTIAAGAGAGTGPTVAVAGTDRAGTITVTPGTTPAAGVQATVTFVGTWPQAPKVSLTPTNAAAQAAGGFVSAKSTTTFAVSSAATPGGAMTFDYVIAA